MTLPKDVFQDFFISRGSVQNNLKLIVLVFIILWQTISYAGIHAGSSLWETSSEIESTEPGKDGIRIGFLLPVSPDNDLLSRSSVQGAELAIKIANQEGGHEDQAFTLVTRIADGLWGSGSKESVDFVHKDRVVAMVTAVDGRNAHLAEQVAAKSQVVQVEVRAMEETLSQAYVPWFFRIVPNDRQQAEGLMEELYVRQGFRNVHVLFEEEYDFENGAESFRKIVKKNGYGIKGDFGYAGRDSGRAEKIIAAIKEDAECLVVFGSYATFKPVLEKIKNAHPSLPVYGALTMTFDGQIGADYSDGCEGGIFLSSKFCFTTPGQRFKDLFLQEYGQMPSPAASYSFDAVNLIIAAVRQVGPDREKIRDVLKDMEYLTGATGPIRFDGNGNRVDPVFLIRLIKGHPVILNQ